MSLWQTLFAFVGGAVASPVAGKVIDAAITLLDDRRSYAVLAKHT